MNEIKNIHVQTESDAWDIVNAFLPYDLCLDENASDYQGWTCTIFRPSEGSGNNSMVVVRDDLVKLVLTDGRIINIWDDSFDSEAGKEDDATIRNLDEWQDDDEPEQSFSESCREKLGTLHHVPAAHTVAPITFSPEELTVILGGLFLIREREITSLADLEATSKDIHDMRQSVSMLSSSLELIERIQDKFAEYAAN